MKTITYTFADGCCRTAEVDDELYAVHLELEQAEKRNHWRETRRHISLDYLGENGIDFEQEDNSPLSALIAQEDEQDFEKALSSFLTAKQTELLQMVWAGYSVTEIAAREGVLHTAISNRLKRILEKLKDFSENRDNLPSAVLIGRGTKSAYYILRGLRQ